MCAGEDVLLRIEGVKGAVAPRGRGQQLHEADGAASRYGARIETRLDDDDRAHQLRLHVRRSGRATDGRVIVGRTRQPHRRALGVRGLVYAGLGRCAQINR